MSDVISQLTLGSLEITGRLVDASNATLYGELTHEDATLSVIYKPIAGERPLWDFPDGNLAQREYAAYLVSEIAKWKIVPPTILREGPFGFGMVQKWIDIDESIDLALYYREDNLDLRRMALFDAVINNTDRKIGHLLPAQDGTLFGCDHGVTFHEEDKLRTVIWQFSERELSDSEIEGLHNLANELALQKEVFLGLITEAEFNALIERINRLLVTGVFPSPSEDWPAVPWPPF